MSQEKLATKVGSYITGDLQVEGDFIGRDQYIGFTATQVADLLTQIRNTFIPKPFDGKCPYIGLAPFQEEMADRFFGRERLIADLLSRVEASRFVVLTGPSGSGKSSLARAGLLNQLKVGALSGSEYWLYNTLRPGRSPLKELARVTAGLTGHLTASNDILNAGKTDATIFHQWAEIALQDHRDRRILLLVDQFEELFTQVADEEERVAFLNLLTFAVTADHGRVIVIFTLRSDFVSNCALYPQLNALLNQQFMQVGAMRPDELVSAIAMPALQVGLRIDSNLIAQIVNEMEGKPGALPLMQFALKDLFEAGQEKGNIITLTLADYFQRGGIQKALERHADTQLAKLSVQEQELAKVVFSGLIQIGRGTQDTGRTATFDELVPAGVEPSIVEQIIRRLADARLVTTDETNEKDIATLSHERLIEAWPWLQRLVKENRDTIALQNQIAEDAVQWLSYQEDVSYLYVGARLATAQEQLTAKLITLTGPAYRFIAESSNAEQAKTYREKRRRRLLLGSLTSVVLIFGIFLLIVRNQNNQLVIQKEELEVGSVQLKTALNEAENNRIFAEAETTRAELQKTIAETEAERADRQRVLAERTAQEAAANALAAQAITNLSYGESAGNLAIQKARDGILATLESDGRVTIDADSALRQVLDQVYWRSKLPSYRHSGSINALTVSSDGEWVASGSDDRLILIWSVLTGEIRHVLAGHEATVTSLAISPDNHYLASSGKDGRLLLWDLADGSLVRKFEGHTGTIWSIAFRPNGKQLASVGDDLMLRLWSMEQNNETVSAVATLVGHAEPIRVVRYDPKGAFLATGGEDNTTRIWDVESQRELRWCDGIDMDVFSLAFHPSGELLLSAGNGNTVHMCNVASGQETARFDIDSDKVRALAYSPDGKYVAVASRNPYTQLWEPSSQHKVVTLHGYSDTESKANIVIFGPDGHTIISGGDDRTIHFWDAKTGEEIRNFGGHIESIQAVAYHPNGKILASGGADHVIRLWDNEQIREIGVLRGKLGRVTALSFASKGEILIGADDQGIIHGWRLVDSRTLFTATGHVGPIHTLAYNHNEEAPQFASGGSDGTVRLWSMKSQTQTVAQDAVFTGHNGSVHTVAYTPDKRYLLSAGEDELIRLWDISLGTIITEMVGHNGSVDSVQVSHDGYMVVSGGTDQTVRLWDLQNGQMVRTFQGHTGPIRAVAFSLDDRLVASAGDDQTVRIWNAMNGSLIRILRGHTDNINTLAFNPTGLTLASGSGGKTGNNSIWLWNISSLTTFNQLTHPASNDSAKLVRWASFSPDRKLIATAGDNWAIRLWEAESSQLIQTIPAHLGPVRSVDFSPDGSMLLSAGDDNIIRLWNRATMTEIRTYRGHTGWVRTAFFSPDGKRIVSASEDKSIRVWTIDDVEATQIFTGHNNVAVYAVFHPDGQRIASAAFDGTVRLWDRNNGQEIRTFTTQSNFVNAVAFSPDGRLLAAATGGADRQPTHQIYIWDLESGVEVHEPLTNEKEVYSVAFSHDGKWLLSAGRAPMRLWNTSTWTPVRELSGHAKAVWSASFSSDDKFIISASEDGTARIWFTEIGDMLKIAHSLLQPGFYFRPEQRSTLVQSYIAK